MNLNPLMNKKFDGVFQCDFKMGTERRSRNVGIENFVMDVYYS